MIGGSLHIIIEDVSQNTLLVAKLVWKIAPTTSYSLRYSTLQIILSSLSKSSPGTSCSRDKEQSSSSSTHQSRKLTSISTSNPSPIPPTKESSSSPPSSHIVSIDYTPYCNNISVLLLLARIHRFGCSKINIETTKEKHNTTQCHAIQWVNEDLRVFMVRKLG
jgi:hypothetical protein